MQQRMYEEKLVQKINMKNKVNDLYCCIFWW